MKKILSLAVAAAMDKSLCMWRWCFHNSNYSSGSKFRFCGTGSAAAAERKNYDNVTLKLSYATGDTGMDGLTAIEFERLVEEKSGGKVQIDRFPTVSLAAAIWFATCRDDDHRRRIRTCYYL
ncbi:MAG: hypothetical protein V8S93_08845 [Lachnospiraceae bacterium]